MLAPAECGRPTDGLNDSLVGAAATDVPFHVTHNLFFSGIRSVFEQCDRGQDHSGRAVTALERFGLQKGPLYWMECFPASQAFNSCNLFSGSSAYLHSA